MGLEAFPYGYKAVLGVDVMELSEDETRQRIRKRVAKFPFPCLQKLFGSCCSPTLVNSFTIRLLSGVTIFPLLSWWLIGFVYVPFVKAPQHYGMRGGNDCGRKAVDEQSQQDEEAQDDDQGKAKNDDEAKSIPKPSRRSAKRKGVCGDIASPIVEMNIPSCVFLKKARDFYGTEKGNAACLNE